MCITYLQVLPVEAGMVHLFKAE